ncbi:SDR family NAD(P)-dependent oxidoreductase [Nevskia ramosa]|uniref:SDR family NAD(P)-dependent oxidoreductase n=1 Tax=Nevskia ramosa TaxID=64002 RepID=UPI003D0EB8D2
MAGRKVSRSASAVVTGAGSGIGRAFALELGVRGGRVVCADLKLATAEETAAQIRAAGGQATAIACDVSKLEQVEKLAGKAEQWLAGPVDLVINNAGVGAGGSVVGETPIDDWRWVLGVNLWGVIHGCHVFAPKLRALGRGGIVNVGSTASFAAAPLMGPYNVSKAAVLALSETLASEFTGTGIKITALCPTFVATNIVKDGRISESSSKMAERLMQWTSVTPESVARTTLDALDRNQLYVLPQVDAKLIWRMKRLAPVGYGRGIGWLNRLAGNRA